MSFSNINFILHEPQLSENIGACARAIKNFNFKKMILIKPKVIYPNEKILATAVGAKDIIKKSKVFDTIQPAIKNIDCLIATTARFRNKNIKHITINDLSKINFKKKVAFLFGSESSGLSNKEISYANYVVQIPTNPNFKSLNLSHSLIIICQIVFSILKTKMNKYSKSKKVKMANKHQIYELVRFCVSNLEKFNFFKPDEKRPIMIENLKSIFFKMDLSQKEIRILSGVFAALTKKKVH